MALGRGDCYPPAFRSGLRNSQSLVVAVAQDNLPGRQPIVGAALDARLINGASDFQR